MNYINRYNNNIAMKTYDVIIIGAGVSGSVAARVLSEKFKVLIIEKADKIGGSTSEKVDVVEVYGLKKYVENLDITPLCITHKSKWHSPSGEVFELELKEEDSYFFKRGSSEDSIENQLMRKSIRNGVEIMLGTTLLRIEKKGGLSRVILSDEGKKKEFLSKVIIGADGIKSMTAKLREFPEISERREVVGFGFHAKDIESIEQGVPEIYFDENFVHRGYLYIAPISDNEVTAVSVMGSRKVKTKKEAKDLFYSFIENNPNLKEKFSKKKVLNEICGHGIISSPRRKTIKDNALLVGNAGGVMDPLFLYGTKNAIITGYIAGKVVSNALNSDDLIILKDYETEWRNEIGRSLRNGMRLRKIFDHMQNKDFDFVIKTLDNLKERKFDFDKAFENFSYSNHLPKILKSSLLVDIKLSLSFGIRVLSYLL
jgi:digeranylgeranylglycerophospholipid reductase